MELEWRKLIITIGDHLNKKNVKDILLLHDIPDGIAEKLKNSGLKTLKELENRNIINPENPSSLHEVLCQIHRFDLKKFVRNFEENFKDVVGDAVEKDIMNPRKDSSELRMSSSPRGICLIISNEKFDPLQNKKDADSSKIAPEYLANNKPSSKDRPGTRVDERSLEETLKWLGFKVRTERNCKADQMYEILKNVSKEDHKEYDAFVCCILTHGTKGQVFGTDWESLEIVQIRGLFEDHVCKSLRGKPKIFLIQACRGDDIDLGYYESIPVEKSERISCPAEGNETFDEFDDENGMGVSSRTSDSVLGEESATPKQRTYDEDFDKDNPSADHKKATSRNFLFVFPSVQGHKSILHNRRGSWLISTVCKVFQQYADTSSLHFMLAEINKKMGFFTSSHDLACKSTTEIQDSLDHHYIYFAPSMTYEAYCKSSGK